jgi:hypothetical protein
VTLHDYTEKGEDLTKRYADNKEAIMRTELYHCDGRSAFANGFSYRGQPVILSEYGGIAFAGGKDGAWGYGNTVRNEADFLSRYDAITTAIKELPWVCGYCYTQVSDVQQEINGLLSEDRSFKVDPEKIREINERPVTGRFI